ALLNALDPKLVPILFQLVSDPALAGAAIRGLAQYDDPATPEVILKAYATLGPAEKRDALATLAARPAYARALVAAVKAKRISVGDVQAAIVRQLRSLRDPALDAAVAEVWGTIRATTSADRAAEISAWRKKLTAPSQSPIDLTVGRAVFAKTCA